MRQPYTKYMRFGWKMQEKLALSDVRTHLDHAISRDKANNPECQRANEEGESNSSKYFSLSRFVLALHYLASIAICMSISVNLTIYLDTFAVDAFFGFLFWQHYFIFSFLCSSFCYYLCLYTFVFKFYRALLGFCK